MPRRKLTRELVHHPKCPRVQFWDAGEYEAPCLCRALRPAPKAKAGRKRRK